MKERKLKYIFFASSLFLLLVMLIVSKDAGISCDEVLHFDQSVSVYNYFATHGADKSALNTPVSHLKYYGQSYDNIVTFLTRWLDIDNVYGFRNLMSAVAGWITVLVTALFAVWLAGYRVGILTLVLFAVSPTYIGHSLNNLKDIPFALGYITGTFYTLKFLLSGRKVPAGVIALLTLSIAFSVSIRAPGMLVIFNLLLFFILQNLFNYQKNNKIEFTELRNKLLWIAGISITAWLLSILLWPYVLQNPVKNFIESFRVMAHYPDTFRQVFEGKVEWSDFMPWYYIPKSMAITVPVIVLTGLILFIFFTARETDHGKAFQYGFIIFTVLFPVLFVVYEKSNLYSSWRQFLFIYPAIVLLAATGFDRLFRDMKKRYFKWAAVTCLIILSFHPLKFMILNHPYYYLYYNQFVGGLKGAYGKYETDYYYVSQTRASEWLIDYLKQKKIHGPLKISANYSVQWQFRDHPEIETSYFRSEERSCSDWDYAIVVSRYVSPYQLKNRLWPPGNSIHNIYADKIPVCAVLERKSKDDYLGYKALSEGRNKDAINYFKNVLLVNDGDEMIFYNFAAVLYNDGQHQKADSVLKVGLKINPDFEPILMYLGNIAMVQNKPDDAIRYYERVIGTNRKYFEAYIRLSELFIDNDLMRARALLRTCLTMSPRYKPAILALADAYRKTNPDIAKKYDDLARTIK
jgi:tetratricopeptide (TPR) repeat protein